MHRSLCAHPLLLSTLCVLGFAVCTSDQSGDGSTDESESSQESTSTKSSDESDAESTSTQETLPSSGDSSETQDETSESGEQSSTTPTDSSTNSDSDTESDSGQDTDTNTGDKCLDKKVGDEEVLPVRADISDLLSSYEPDQRLPWAISVLERRYPTGAFILAEANNKTDCFEISIDDPSKAENVIKGLRTAVHECGHMIDLNVPQRYVIREDLIYNCDFKIATDGPPRKIILEDEFQAKWANDSFRETYLEMLGDQTFDALLDEASQYINTLATSYAFYDITTFDPVARDGAHAFYWYVARFLRKSRMEHAEFYEKLVGDTCWRQVILATWGRSERYLVETQGLEGLGGSDDKLLHDLRNAPELLEEIELLRMREGCK